MSDTDADTAPAAGTDPATATDRAPDGAAVADDEVEDFGPGLEEPNARARFLIELLDQVGTDFEMGARAEFDDAKPAAFDASELVEWASHRAGVGVPDGSWLQYQHLDDEGATMEVDDALQTEGALLFWFSRDPIGNPDRPRIAHVAVSLGDGRVIEATPGEHDIVRIAEHDGRFTHAGEIPGLVGVDMTINQSFELWDRVDRIADDQDQDRIPDRVEARRGTDPGSTDSDNDGVSDLAEYQLDFHEHSRDRSDLDADRDGLLDVAELRLGTDPNSFDTDGDGIDDHLEIMTGLDPNEFNVSMFARSEVGQSKSHEAHAGSFGTQTLDEHLQYLRLEADPTDPRVPEWYRENFERFGREPSVENEAAFDEWHRRFEEAKQADEASAGTDDPSTTTDEGDADGLGAESPPAADQESADDASPTAADVIPPPAGEAAVADGALPVAGVDGALPVAGADGVLPVDGADAGPDFGALDDDLAVIETDLLEP
ncbi:MAG: hypothetical protein AAGA93_23000, partial [Actinomycetota bacterium]